MKADVPDEQIITREGVRYRMRKARSFVYDDKGKVAGFVWTHMALTPIEPAEKETPAQTPKLNAGRKRKEVNR